MSSIRTLYNSLFSHIVDIGCSIVEYNIYNQDIYALNNKGWKVFSQNWLVIS